MTHHRSYYLICSHFLVFILASNIFFDFILSFLRLSVFWTISEHCFNIAPFSFSFLNFFLHYFSVEGLFYLPSSFPSYFVFLWTPFLQFPNISFFQSFSVKLYYFLLCLFFCLYFPTFPSSILSIFRHVSNVNTNPSSQLFLYYSDCLGFILWPLPPFLTWSLFFFSIHFLNSFVHGTICFKEIMIKS